MVPRIHGNSLNSATQHPGYIIAQVGTRPLTHRKSQTLSLIAFHSNRSRISLTFIVTVVTAATHLAGADACNNGLFGMRGGFKKGVAHDVHTIAYGDGARMTFIVDVVGTLGDIARGNLGISIVTLVIDRISIIYQKKGRPSPLH